MPHLSPDTVFPLASTALIACAAVVLDRLLGEPRRWHPLAGFGALAQWMEARLRNGAPGHAIGNRLRGVIAWLLLVAPISAFVGWVASRPGGWLLDLALLYFALGGQTAGGAGKHRSRQERQLRYRSDRLDREQRDRGRDRQRRGHAGQ